MKKLTFILLSLGCFLAFSEAKAQTTQSSTSSKDEFWGTAKVQDKGSSTDAVGRRASGLDTRFNTYEGNKRSRFSKDKIANSKRMKEILKKEKKMMKKHKRDKRRLERRRRGND
ncbi:MAG: hypothetical protein LPK07_04095 [Hymenobacteraceae bacterium]|nr:hypothetical protein [Hymenobacteraceae bacterium]MDX5480843.1 hypothetical protein [Hymenobacteraceae bacterium]